MIYVSWAAYFEGVTDREYFRVLLPRVMQDIVAGGAIQSVTIPEDMLVIGASDRTVEAVAVEACNNRDSFHLWFIHADIGGRALEDGLASRSEAYADRAFQLCRLPKVRSINVAPKKETEAWVLADRRAVLEAFGLSAGYDTETLPRNPPECERLADPKVLLDEFATEVNRRRYRRGASFLYPTIGQRQDLAALRRMPSFNRFEADLRTALASLGCIAS
jgi:hypothetical protein